MLKEGFIEITGKENGPTSVILVGVHGNERCGIDAIEQILPSLEIKRGKIFIGLGNPRATEQNVRFTEENLNRMFKDEILYSDKEKNSYEYKRAQYLKTFFEKADVLLDIHASFTPESKPFIICETNAENIYKKLPFDLIVHGFDNVEPGGTDYYMNKIGKIGICAECGFLGDENSLEIAKKTISNFLVARMHIDGEIEQIPQQFISMKELYLTKTEKFTLTKQFSDFEKVKINEPIGFDGDKEVRAPYDGVILFARDRTKIGEEAFLFGVRG